MQVQVFHYAGCSTCKNALRWLQAHGVTPATTDLVATPPDAATLGEVRRLAGVDARKLFNTSGLVYRGEGWADKAATLDEAGILQALAGNGRLIKRPLLVVEHDDGTRTARIGFREAEWLAALGRP